MALMKRKMATKSQDEKITYKIRNNHYYCKYSATVDF